MTSKAITEHLQAFVGNFPAGSVADFANYLRTMQSIQEL